jgi:hypothetical protein
MMEEERLKAIEEDSAREGSSTPDAATPAQSPPLGPPKDPPQDPFRDPPRVPTPPTTHERPLDEWIYDSQGRESATDAESNRASPPLDSEPAAHTLRPRPSNVSIVSSITESLLPGVDEAPPAAAPPVHEMHNSWDEARELETEPKSHVHEMHNSWDEARELETESKRHVQRVPQPHVAELSTSLAAKELGTDPVAKRSKRKSADEVQRADGSVFSDLSTLVSSLPRERKPNISASNPSPPQSNKPRASFAPLSSYAELPADNQPWNFDMPAELADTSIPPERAGKLSPPRQTPPQLSAPTSSQTSLRLQTPPPPQTSPQPPASPSPQESPPANLSTTSFLDLPSPPHPPPKIPIPPSTHITVTPPPTSYELSSSRSVKIRQGNGQPAFAQQRHRQASSPPIPSPLGNPANNFIASANAPWSNNNNNSWLSDRADDSPVSPEQKYQVPGHVPGFPGSQGWASQIQPDFDPRTGKPWLC